MDPTFENRYNRIITELQVYIHNRAPRSQIDGLVAEAYHLFEEIEQCSLTMDYINSVFIQNTLIKYRTTLNETIKPLDRSSRTSSTISNDTEALRQTTFLAKQLESDLGDVNGTIHKQGDQIRSWNGTLDQISGIQDRTDSTLKQMENRWCIIC